MLIGQKGVKYGLQVRSAPKPKAAAPARKPSVFGEEDSDDDAKGNVEQQIARQAARKQTDKKVAELHAAALAEDASIFDYDSHYDSIQQARAEPKKQEKLQRQSRYIAGLLEKAEERKQEQDILYERQLAKERAAEDHLFGDKEKFVTAAYRAKLAERQAWQAEQKRKKEEEEANAVEKRGHMGDFYRNLLRSNVAFGGKAEQPGAKKAAAAAAADEHQQKAQQQRQEEDELEGAADKGRGRSAPAAAAAAGVAGAEQPPRDEDQQDRLGGVPSSRHVPRDADRAGKDVGVPGGRATASESSFEEAKPQVGSGPAAAAAAAAAEAPSGDTGAPTAAAAAAATATAGQRRNKQDAVAAARERYLARKRQKTG